MRRRDQKQAVQNIPLEQLKPFKDHPFQVRDDEGFRHLVESIETHGVIHPAVARQIGERCYELISGHRRKAACEVLGLTEMPVLIRPMTDDEAVVNMVVVNLQREIILPSERAFAYMCTVKEIREAIWEDCRSQRDMESIDIDRVLQALPFSRHESLLDQPPLPKRPSRTRNNTKINNN